MKKIILLTIFCIPIYVFCQKGGNNDFNEKKLNSSDSNAYFIQKNIYKLTIGTPLKKLSYYVPDIMLLGNYEHALDKNVSVAVNAGVRMYNQSFGVCVADPVTSYHFTGTAEIRYYYALQNRTKKLRHTKNYTGGYLSVSQYLLTNPFAIQSKSKQVSEKDAAPKQAGFYLNIGYQKQFKQFYFNGYGGILILNETSSIALTGKLHIPLKPLIYMHLTLLLSILCIFNATAGTHAQTVSVKMSKTERAKVLGNIEQQGSFRFLFNSRLKEQQYPDLMGRCKRLFQLVMFLNKPLSTRTATFILSNLYTTKK
jgi:hypothetical protein